MAEQIARVDRARSDSDSAQPKARQYKLVTFVPEEHVEVAVDGQLDVRADR